MKKLLCFLPVLLFFALTSCNKDDDGPNLPPPRDEGVVYSEDSLEIQDFLATHYFYLKTDLVNPNFKRVVFDTIDGDNANKTPLIDSPMLKSKTVKPGDFAYTLYYLQIRKGAEEQYQPTFGDKIVLTYQFQTLDGDVLDKNINPDVIDIPKSADVIITKGTTAGITEFKGASGFVENPDGTITYNDDYGIGAVFVPSGLGYFQTPPAYINLKPYQPFVLTFQLYKGIQMDHDNDGIPSYMEDLNGNHFLGDDDTDDDRTANYLDADDDGDGIPTREEIIVNDANGNGIIAPGEIEFPDTGNLGIPDYLNPKR